MITVYYDAREYDGVSMITVTEKGYWERNRSIDDGGGRHYEAIDAAMESTGAVNLAESVYDPRGRDVKGVIDAMRAKGFDMRADPGFSAYAHKD